MSNENKGIGISMDMAEGMEVLGQSLADHAKESWLDIDCLKCGHGCYWEPGDFGNYQCQRCGDRTHYKLNTRTQ